MQKNKIKLQQYVKNEKESPLQQTTSDSSESTIFSAEDFNKKTDNQSLFLQSVINGVADPIIVVGADFHIKLMNSAAREFSQSSDLSSSPKCHQFMFGLSKPCDGKNRSCPLSRVQASGAPVIQELVYDLPNGKRRIFEILASPMLSTEGEFLGIVESLRDITIRKNFEDHLLKDHDALEKHVEKRTAELIKANASLRKEALDRQRFETELSKAKEQAELTYRVIPSAIFTVDTNQRITSWNDKAEDVTGFSSKEVLGKKCDFFALNPCTKVCGVFSPDVVKPIVSRECEIRTKSGDVRIVSKNADLLRDLDGSVIGAVESFEDITEMKLMTEELRTERDKFRGMLSAVGQGMHIVNNDFIIEFQNDVLRDAFGDRIGDKCFAVYKHQNSPCEICAMRMAIETKETQRTEVIMANDRCYEQSYVPFMDVDGESKVLIMLRDVTDEKAHQAETLRAGQLASVGELAAGVAHEINNPINGIINYAQIMLDEIKEGQPVSTTLEKVIREGERIATIVSNLLSFARQHDEERDEVHVIEVINDSVDLLRHQLMKNSIALEIHLPGNLSPVYVNHQQLQQVFLNVLSNARFALNKKYPGKNSNKKIEISGEEISTKDGSFVRISFKDYGTGIPDDLIAKIFDPFFSSKEPGEGTGLGLSISHGIVKNFKGHMHVKSLPGTYTIMNIDIPAYDPQKES